MLRRTVMIAAALGLGLAAIAVGNDHAAWPMLLPAGLLFAGCVFERFHYRGPEQPSAGPWEVTGERFLDERSGLPVSVWFNPATGERRYVDAEKVAPR
jgi:hypothetical protein